MENKIVITEDLSNILVALYTEEELRERNIDKTTSKMRAQFLRNLIKINGYNYDDLFSMLTHFLLLYDKIEMPFYNIDNSKLSSEMASVLEYIPSIPEWIIKKSWEKPYKKEYVPNELAIVVKPIVMNACMHDFIPDHFSSYAIETVGSVENLYNYMFDRSYYRVHFEENDRIESDLNEVLTERHISYDFRPDLECVVTFYDSVEHHLHDLLLIRNLAKEGARDFYTPSFSNYHNSINANDAYCILKTQISMIMEEQPAFESLTDIIRFREQKHRDIKLLRNEVSNLESLLIQGEKEHAIQKAINDVRSANQALIKNTPVKQTAKLATYLSVPISLLELYTFGTSYSILIGAVGTTAQFIADYKDSKNNWLFVAR